MTSIKSNEDVFFTKMKDHIDKILDGTLNINSFGLSPQPSCTQLYDAYTNLKLFKLNYTIVRESYPIKVNPNEWIVSYTTYMVNYLEKYWVMTVGYNNDFSYNIEEYSDYLIF